MIKLTSFLLNMTIIFSLGNMKAASLLLILISLLTSCYGLTQPTWQSSLFIEARNKDIIVTTEKLSGFYTYSIAFAASQFSPIIALGIFALFQHYLRLDGHRITKLILK